MNELDQAMAAQKTIVLAEFERALDRCEAEGVPRYAAHSVLTMHLASPLLDALMPEASNPNLLEDIFALDQQGQTALARQKSLDWLKLTHGVELGDTVLVSGWVSPREVVLEDFSLMWSPVPGRTHLAAQDGTMVLTGMTVHSQGVSMKTNMTRIHAKVEKQAQPTPRLGRALGRRVAPHI